MLFRALVAALAAVWMSSFGQAAEITAAGQPAQLDIRAAGEHSVRVTLKPINFEPDFPFTPALAERAYPAPAISLREINAPVRAKIGNLNVEVRPEPLMVVVTTADGKPVQEITFEEDGNLSFKKSAQPILGLGEGGPQPGPRGNWRQAQIQFDRNGASHQMIPRWESNAYGSRNPVAMLIGTEGWGLFVAAPWPDGDQELPGVDLRDAQRGIFRPWQPPAAALERVGRGQRVGAASQPVVDQQDQPPQVAQEPQPGGRGEGAQPGEGARRGERGARGARGQRRGNRGGGGQNLEGQIQGRPPVESIIPGAYDVFIFDGHNPAQMMKDISVIAGPAVLPPKWSLGYMQSHRELRDDNMESENLLLWVVDTFREKKIPVDAVIYLGTGFTPTGWNTQQPSFNFNSRVFRREPKEVLDDLHERNVKVIVHMVPWRRSAGRGQGSLALPTLQGNIPPKEGEVVDNTHILDYWKQHEDLVATGVDAWWPDEGDWFDLFERIKRHQLYYQGPLSTEPNERPWSLHRNGHLGIAKWGGWVWSGDTQAAWKTLEGQIAVGINHSLSIGPYWGSDTGGFYTGVNPPELTGELYTRWFQFSAFNPSFRSHGRIWRLRVPWGWGLADYGFVEGQQFPPDRSELNNPEIENVCRKIAELRYQLIPYTYTLAADARDTGMPFMRAMWLHYPEDERTRGMGDQFLWGRDILVAPVYTRGATSRNVYLPAGDWYDWWTNEKQAGGRTVTRNVDLATIPLYVRAGAIVPFDPVRQYMEQEVTEPTTIKVFAGADGNYRWYEDDGKSQEYLAGKFMWTELAWNDAAKRLVIEHDGRAGTLESRPRKLVVELLPSGEKKEINYDGRRAEVGF
jgi:alpha-glucosidase/alpha-D-xyloside xylohydrolase